jgi:hypothetical protein
LEDAAAAEGEVCEHVLVHVGEAEHGTVLELRDRHLVRRVRVLFGELGATGGCVQRDRDRLQLRCDAAGGEIEPALAVVQDEARPVPLRFLQIPLGFGLEGVIDHRDIRLELEAARQAGAVGHEVTGIVVEQQIRSQARWLQKEGRRGLQRRRRELESAGVIARQKGGGALDGVTAVGEAVDAGALGRGTAVVGTAARQKQDGEAGDGQAAARRQRDSHVMVLFEASAQEDNRHYHRGSVNARSCRVLVVRAITSLAVLLLASAMRGRLVAASCACVEEAATSRKPRGEPRRGDRAADRRKPRDTP